MWALRSGLIGILTLWFCVRLWMDFSITANPDVPHFGTGLVAVLAIAALGTYGALTASRTTRAANRV